MILICNCSQVDGTEKYLIEPFIKGAYEKFNSNSGWANMSHPLMQALSHYSWHSTEGAHPGWFQMLVLRSNGAYDVRAVVWPKTPRKAHEGPGWFVFMDFKEGPSTTHCSLWSRCHVFSLGCDLQL